MPVRPEDYQALANTMKQLHCTYQEILDVGIKIEYCKADDLSKWMNSRHRLVVRGQELTDQVRFYIKNEEWMGALNVSQEAWVQEFRQSIIDIEPAIIQQHHHLVKIIRNKSHDLRGQLVQKNTQKRAMNAYMNAPGSRMMVA